MTDNEFDKARKAAADALINWAKTDMRQFVMRDAENNYLEASGANRPPSVAMKLSSYAEKQ